MLELLKDAALCGERGIRSGESLANQVIRQCRRARRDC